MQEKLLSDRCMGCGLDSRGGVPPLGRRRSKDGWVKELARLRTGGGAF